jgi:hypothetical protein
VAFARFVNLSMIESLHAQRCEQIRMPETNQPPCKHTRTRIIAKDNDAQYVECLDCGSILEAGELKDLKENSGFGESLSDA